MAIAHSRLPSYGVQFHPESICSSFGAQLVTNFLVLAKQHRPALAPALSNGHALLPGVLTSLPVCRSSMGLCNQKQESACFKSWTWELVARSSQSRALCTSSELLFACRASRPEQGSAARLYRRCSAAARGVFHEALRQPEGCWRHQHPVLGAGCCPARG